MRQLQVRNRSDCRNPPLKTAPATRWEADVHNRAKTRFPRQGARNRADTTSRMKKGGPALSQASFFAPLGRKPRISQIRRPKPNQSNDARSTTRPSPIDLAVQSLRASPIDYATHSTTQPSPTGRTTQSIMQLSPTKHTAQPAPRPSPIAHAVPSATRSTRRRRPHAPEPHAHRATDEYPGPSSARSRASPSRARGTHRRARARSPRPRRPAAPRTPARAHASSR